MSISHRILMSLVVLAALCLSAQTARFERQVLAMGTTLALDLAGPSEAVLQTASQLGLAEIERIEAGISTWRPDSLFSRLNQAHGAVVPMDREWLDLLGSVRRQARETGGAFDPALGPLISAWGLRTGGPTPSKSLLAQARRASGFTFLRLGLPPGTAQLLRADAALEEGAFGKGYALDRAAAVIRGAGTVSALLDFGGQLLAFGSPRVVALADPQDRLRPRLSFPLKEASLATSGTSERGAHILNPSTGRPASTWGSVGVVGATGLKADCLSTALFVLGPRRGLRWATTHQVAACFLLNDGRIRMSPAFRALRPTLL